MKKFIIAIIAIAFVGTSSFANNISTKFLPQTIAKINENKKMKR